MRSLSSDGNIAVDVNLRKTLTEVRDILSHDPKRPEVVRTELDFNVNGLPRSANEGSTGAWIVSIDKIGMGLANLSSFERTMQKISGLMADRSWDKGSIDWKAINNLLMTVGKDVTEDFQGNIIATKNYLIENGFKIMGERMGGDEFVIVLEDPGKAKPEVLANIKRITGTRVAATSAVSADLEYFQQNPEAVSWLAEVKDSNGSRRVSIPPLDFPRVAAFIKSIFDAEDVIALLKDLEKQGIKDVVAMMLPDGRIEVSRVIENNGTVRVEKQGLWRAVRNEQDVLSFVKADHAQNSDMQGGIDFNTAALNLEHEGQSSLIRYPSNMFEVDTMEIHGLVPVIVAEKPVDNILTLMSGNDIFPVLK
jgi:hypothetical protein